MDKLKAAAYDALCQIELWKQKLIQTQKDIENYKPEEEVDFEPKKHE
jgi:hypothetical protein